MKASMSHRTLKPRSLLTFATALASLVFLASPLAAFQFGKGELSGSFDTTISAGALYRLNSPDPNFYGRANGGLQNSVNSDDANLNYDKGVVSSLLKASHDLELKWHDFSFFARGYYFLDTTADDTKRTSLSQQAEDRVVRGEELLDLYVTAKFNSGSVPLDIRFGRQVLSLGESTFIPNGINVVTPRFVLLHTLAHLMIRQMEFSCGYPAASLKERLYFQSPSEDLSPMAGILIYVAVPDKVGSLGGLVEIAEPGRFLDLMMKVFNQAAWCSFDPVCSEHDGHGPDMLNRAACHACALIPETACEYGNALLDRVLISGELKQKDGIPPLLDFIQMWTTHEQHTQSS